MVDNKNPKGHESDNIASINQSNGITRRRFITKGIAATGSISMFAGLISRAAFAKTPATTLLNLDSLRAKFTGQLITPQDTQFNEIVFGKLWNELRPTRKPQLVAQVNSAQDVAEVIKYARANKIKVNVRGGGHNWYSLSNRNSGILIDLSNLNKIISIDPAAKRAVVQPILSNREVQAALKPYGLAYPTGHCPTVKMSGYLLSGGMSWNQGAWGPGIGSVEAVQLVTAEGKIIEASAEQNQDYYWAARGAGPSLFAVATQYRLKLYDLPKNIVSSVYYYPYEDMASICDWLGPLARTLPSNLELSAAVIDGTTVLNVRRSLPHNGKVFMIAAALFANSADEIDKALSPLEKCPVIEKCISKSVAQPTDFDGLFDASGAMWPPGLRCQADALFYKADLSQIFKTVKETFTKTISPQTLIMISIFTGKDGLAPLPDAAFSMTAKLYGGPWTMWQDAKDDKQNIDWHQQCVKSLLPLTSGHYISETDIVDHPDYVKASYKEENRKRLAELRHKYDPQGIFFNYLEGLD